jgi:prevent-host-death family protein
MYMEMYTMGRVMTSRSVAETRRELPGLIHSVERGAVVEVTRRGQPVAVLVPVEQYRSMQVGERAFGAAIQDFRRVTDLTKLRIGTAWLRRARLRRDRGRRTPW